VAQGTRRMMEHLVCVLRRWWCLVHWLASWYAMNVASRLFKRMVVTAGFIAPSWCVLLVSQ
jgi:hypothetical protein